MREPVRRFLLAAIALGFLLGGIAQAKAEIAALCCAGATHHSDHHDKGQKHAPCEGGQICGCCLAPSALPTALAAASTIAFTGGSVVFRTVTRLPSGRSIIPDPAPPKPIA